MGTYIFELKCFLRVGFFVFLSLSFRVNASEIILNNSSENSVWSSSFSSNVNFGEALAMELPYISNGEKKRAQESIHVRHPNGVVLGMISIVLTQAKEKIEFSFFCNFKSDKIGGEVVSDFLIFDKMTNQEILFSCRKNDYRLTEFSTYGDEKDVVISVLIK